jgi:hypothetical protein
MPRHRQKGGQREKQQEQGRGNTPGTGNTPRRDYADGQDGSQKEERGQDGSQKEERAEERKDTERTQAKAVSEKNKTQSVATVAVAAALKDKAEERGGEEGEGGKEGTVEERWPRVRVRLKEYEAAV